MRHSVALLAAVTTATVLAACGSSTSAPAAGGKPAASTVPSDQRNAADVTFIQTMIPDHEQAVEMAALATSHASSAGVKTLAGQIRHGQEQRLTQMNASMSRWGGASAMPGGMGGGAGRMAGMMSNADMTRLQGMSGAGFDRDFLVAMTAHHSGAIAAARTEQSDGRDGSVKNIAADIVRTQSPQVALMADLLRAVP